MEISHLNLQYKQLCTPTSNAMGSCDNQRDQHGGTAIRRHNDKGSSTMERCYKEKGKCSSISEDVGSQGKTP